jgi:uncharacterized protein (TIGR00369 family)
MKKLADSTNCFVCGRDNPCSLKIPFYLEDSGEVVSHFKLSDHYEGHPGIMHGGVIAAILDEICGRAITSLEGEFMVTSKLDVRYRKPVPINQDLVAKALLVSRRDRVGTAHGEILDAQGTLLAEAEGVYVQIPEEKVKEMDPERSGWRVEPDDQ